jgi:hypothetical protein
VAPGRQVRAAPATAECSPGSQALADLTAAAGEINQGQDRRCPVGAFVPDNSNPGDLAAGVELDPDRMCLAPNPVLEADGERIALVDDRAAAFKQQPRAFWRARHQSLLAPVENKDCQLRYSKDAPTGPFNAYLKVCGSPRQCCRPAFERSPFRAYPGLVCCFAFERPELRKHPTSVLNLPATWSRTGVRGWVW